MPLSGIDFALLNEISKQLGQATLDPSMWPSIMEDICRAIKATGAALLQSDVRTIDMPTTDSVREIFDSYYENNLHVDDVRAVRGVPKLLNGASVISDQDLFSSEREMLRDPLYANLNTLGFRWFAAVGLRAGDALWGLSLQRTTREGMFQADELAALATLSRRLTETATLSKAVGRQVLTGMTNAFSLVRQPALAVDRHGFVKEINIGALSLFDEGFRIRNGRVFVTDGTSRIALANLFDKLRVTPDHEAIEQEAIVVRRNAKPPIVIRVLPVDGAARSPFLGARAILIMSEVGRQRPLSPTWLQNIFGMTPAESKLGVLLASGISLEDAAERLSVKRETVRNQLKAIFVKTNTHRQPELVALLSGIK